MGPRCAWPLLIESQVVTAEKKPEAVEAEEGYEPRFEKATLKVLRKDIVRSIQTAFDRALKSMRTAIDHEFAPAPGAAPQDSAS